MQSTFIQFVFQEEPVGVVAFCFRLLLGSSTPHVVDHIGVGRLFGGNDIVPLDFIALKNGAIVVAHRLATKAGHALTEGFVLERDEVVPVLLAGTSNVLEDIFAQSLEIASLSAKSYELF